MRVDFARLQGPQHTTKFARRIASTFVVMSANGESDPEMTWVRRNLDALKHVAVIGRLIGPGLGLGFVLAIVAAVEWPAAAGFFVNVAAGIFTSFVTVGLIDFFMREADRARWRRADRRVAGRLRTFASGTAFTMREALRAPRPEPQQALSEAEAFRIQIAHIEQAADTMRSRAVQYLEALDAPAWKLFVADAARIRADAEGIVRLHDVRLSEEQLEHVLAIADESQGIVGDGLMLDVIEGRAPEQADECRATARTYGAEHVAKILDHCVELARSTRRFID